MIDIKAIEEKFTNLKTSDEYKIFVYDLSKARDIIISALNEGEKRIIAFDKVE